MESTRLQQVHLGQVDGHGLFLENGSRFYIDSGGHPELATPECTDPGELVRYVLAGEKILSRAAARVESGEQGTASVMVLKSNVDYSGSRATWGCHESYLLRSDPPLLAEEIIPHLVSRLIYTGAGGFDSTAPGVEFTLSPRTAHLVNTISSDSTSSRGIFHSKDEPLARAGLHRLHLLCGESLSSERAMWLKVGATALVVAMADAGLRPARGLELCSPLGAMRAFASDPSCTASVFLRDGRKVTASDIQLRYLEQAEAHLGAAFMPAWAREVTEEWRRTLHALRLDPGSQGRSLDWAIKRRLYLRRAERSGWTWDSLRHWNRVARETWSPSGDSDGGRWRRRGRDFAAFLKLRGELLEFDTRLGEIGPRGLFAALERAGEVDHRLPWLGSVERATREPPSESRASLRGALIRRLASRSDCYCDWGAVWDFGSNYVADLSDPFERKESWRYIEGRQPPPGPARSNSAWFNSMTESEG